MTTIVKGIVLTAATLFIAVSASMNAAFLSSFGRTALETGLLGCVSIAADAVKAVLPVVLLRAVAVRAWAHAVMTGMMLAVVVAMSVASGFGFAAMTRGAAVTARDAIAEALAARQTELRELEIRLSALPVVRSMAEIEADLETRKLDRAWTSSQLCTQMGGTAARQLCTGVIALQAERATAIARDAQLAERARLRQAVERLRGSGAGADSDPQATALAELLGSDRKLPRVILTTSLAVLLELGSLVLVVLAAGPAVLGWREPGSEPAAPLRAAALPASVDRAHWQKRQSSVSLGSDRGANDAR